MNRQTDRQREDRDRQRQRQTHRQTEIVWVKDREENSKWHVNKRKFETTGTDRTEKQSSEKNLDANNAEAQFEGRV